MASEKITALIEEVKNLTVLELNDLVKALEEIMALAELPAKDVLQAQALGMMLAPITSLAIVLKAIAEKGGEPAAETPAEETPAAE